MVVFDQECAGPLLAGGLSLLSVDLGWNNLNQQAVEELSGALAWNKSVTKVKGRKGGRKEACFGMLLAPSVDNSSLPPSPGVW